MAKGKTLNPADAHRKALRAKEVKKNKENRSKARETATLKKDTSGIETEIHELESLEEAKLNQTQKARLKELRAEVERVRKIKQDYVQAHPEQAHLVKGLDQRPRRQQDAGSAPSTSGNIPAARSLFGKKGLPIRPERSLYYDPVMNPYGMPPPGMPYIERALLPHEIEEDRLKSQALLQDDNPNADSAMNSASDDSEEDESESDDDIALPAGPPPDDSKEASDASSEDSDDDIPMPPGPPPTKTAPPLPQGGLPPQPYPMGIPYGTQFPPFPPTISQYTQMVPHIPPPPGLPVTMHTGYPPPFIQGMQPYPQQIAGPGQGMRPPRDRQHMEAARAIQDPMSNIPHVTFQAHQAQRHQLPLPPSTGSGSQPPAQSGLPPRPGGTSQAAASATIFAEPELRDLKKEATAFVPASMRRAAKKGPSTSANPSGFRIDAAPDDKDDGGLSIEPKKDLMSVLGNQLGVSDKAAASTKPKGGQGKDDYDKFLAEVGSFL